MAREFDLTPQPAPRIETPLRRIVTKLPVPESLPTLEKLQRYEPLAMRGQPPVVWQRAEGFQVFDAYGNCWIDWSSGVLITNAGHGRQEIIDAIIEQAASGLLTSYGFAIIFKSQRDFRDQIEKRGLAMARGLASIGATALMENRLLVQRALEEGRHDPDIRRVLVVNRDHDHEFLYYWLSGNLDPGFVQVPFPDGFRTPDTSFEYFERCLAEQNVDARNVAAVIVETYQGASSAFAPREYMQSLRDWCTKQNALLVLDEVQAGFGRTGTMWGFEHYGIVPDLALFGKGISSSLPLAAVAGSAEIMDSQPIGTMTSTHTGNPVCCAAALASIDIVVNEKLAANACSTGDVLHQRLHEIQARFPEIGCVQGKGLVAGLSCVTPGTTTPNANLAWEVVRHCFENGVLMFAPVGFGGATVKIAPPLVITEAAILESTDVLEKAFEAQCK